MSILIDKCKTISGRNSDPLFEVLSWTLAYYLTSCKSTRNAPLSLSICWTVTVHRGCLVYHSQVCFHHLIHLHHHVSFCMMLNLLNYSYLAFYKKRFSNNSCVLFSSFLDVNHINKISFP